MKSERPDPYSSEREIPEEWKSYRLKRTKKVLDNKARNVVIDALDRNLQFKEARRVQFCGLLWREWKHRLPNGREVSSWRQLTCRSRYCPYCARAWTAEVIDRLETAPPVYASMMLTLTVPNSNSLNLRERIKDLLATWKIFRDRLRRVDGLLGGMYSLEITVKKTDSGSWNYHPHLHVLARFENHGWLSNDERYLRDYPQKRGAITPAYLHILERWQAAMSKARPKLFNRLPDLEAVLPKGIGAALFLVDKGYNLRLPEKWAAVDVSGRSPLVRVDQREEDLSLLKGDLVDAREILKYALKDTITPSAAEGDPIGDDYIGLSFVVNALHGRRRAQPFGDCYRLKVPDPEEMEDPEVDIYKEMEDYPNGWTGRVSVWVGVVQDGYWFEGLKAFNWRVRDGTSGNLIEEVDGWKLFDTGQEDELEEFI